MYTINDFTNAVYTALSAAYPECRIKAVNVTKNNGVRLTGMAIQPKNKKIAPTLYMEPYFDMLQSGQPFDTVIHQIINSCKDALSSANTGIDVGGFTDFGQVKDKICYKLVGMEKNSGFLSEVPHRGFHGLAVVYYLHLSMTDNGLATATVTDTLARAWGTEEETLYRLARDNTPKINRGCVKPITDILSSLSGCPGTHHPSTYGSFDFTNIDDGGLPMYVATNQNKTFGAGILLYDGFLDAVAEKLGSFYILPSSVHELIIIPDTFGDPSELKKMVGEINAAEVPEEEVLSDNIFHYDANTHELETAV